MVKEDPDNVYILVNSKLICYMAQHLFLEEYFVLYII